MKTKAELQQNILNIAMKIQIEFPALAQHIKEMPSLFLSKEHDHNHIKILEIYYNKLKSVLVEHSNNHFHLESIHEPEVLNFSSSPTTSSSHETHIYGKTDNQLMTPDPSINQNEEIILSDKNIFRTI